jgi:two-component system response regulator AtoC
MKRVLVLDDERIVRELICEILARAGYHVVSAEKPEAALALVEADAFDLLVTDVVMPGLSGLDVLERVKAVRPELPVVVVTGAGTDQNLATAVERGAAAAITKPFTHAELREAVATALGL